jgi:transposase-like protein
MTTKERDTKLSAVEAVAGDRDLIKALMKESLQDVLEGEMNEFLGAAPSERTEARSGNRAGHDGRNLVTRIGKLELRVPRDRCGEFSTALSRATPLARTPWWPPWPRCTCRALPS